MYQPEFTPEEVMKVAKLVLKAQSESGRKPGWVYYEMKRRADAVIVRLLCYDNLASVVHSVANGEATEAELMEWLREMYDSRIQQ